MKVKELIESLEEFQKKLIEHQTLYNNSFPKYTGGMYPVRNKYELQEQSLRLNRWWGTYQPTLNKFRDKMTTQTQSTGDEWDYVNSAIGLDEVAPIKIQSLKKIIAEIERIIGRLISMNSNRDVYNLSDNFKKVEQFSASNAWGISRDTSHFLKGVNNDRKRMDGRCKREIRTRKIIPKKEYLL